MKRRDLQNTDEVNARPLPKNISVCVGGGVGSTKMWVSSRTGVGFSDSRTAVELRLLPKPQS